MIFEHLKTAIFWVGNLNGAITLNHAVNNQANPKYAINKCKKSMRL